MIELRRVLFPLFALFAATLVVAGPPAGARTLANSHLAKADQIQAYFLPSGVWISARAYGVCIAEITRVPGQSYAIEGTADSNGVRGRCVPSKHGTQINKLFPASMVSPPATISVQTADGTTSVSVVSYPDGPCDPSDIKDLLAGPLKGAPTHGAFMIAWRVHACQTLIAAYTGALPPLPPSIVKYPATLPTLTPQPSPPRLCQPIASVDTARQYALLDYCYSWIARNIPSPAPAPSPTLPAIVFHTPGPIEANTAPRASNVPEWTKAIYVLALATDAATSAQISLQLADDLRDCKFSITKRDCPHDTPRPYPTDLYAQRTVRYQVIAEPTWTLNQYQQQCFADPATEGAIVVLPPGIQNGSFNFLVSASWSAMTLQAIVLDCEPTNRSYTNNAAYITYITHVRTATGRRYSVSFSTLLAALSGYLAVHPAKEATYAISSPTPPPGKFYESGYTTNVNSAAAAAVGAAALTQLSTSNIGQGGGPPGDVSAQVAVAMVQLLPNLLNDLMAPCPQHGIKSPYELAWDPKLPYAPQCRWFSNPREGWYQPPTPAP